MKGADGGSPLFVKKPYEQQLRALLVLEFNLPEDFVFDVDIHWELGNDWEEFDV